MPQRKIFNDPVHGFISIPQGLVFDLVEHPWFQRLRRIKQLGLTPLVYPGALHTRFHHTLGAMHLMEEAIDVLRLKGHAISHEEALGAIIAILLHDIGHGPFSHALEHSIVSGMPHELISDIFMDRLNTKFNNQLELALALFRDNYPKRFLHQLVSSQLDVDRLDYLKRDSYFTGVSEGSIGTDRIIKMFEVSNDQLVAEAKATYSIENFLVARRLMYWQVYLHKTAVAAEKMLIKVLARAKELSNAGTKLFASPALLYFLENKVDKEYYEKNRDEVLANFIKLDDNDIWSALKVWADNEDIVLSKLSSGLVNRKLFKIEISTEPVDPSYIKKYEEKYMKELNISEYEASYLYSSDVIYTNMYNESDDSIDILYNDGSIKDISDASDMLNIQLLSKTVEKYYFSYLKL